MSKFRFNSNPASDYSRKSGGMSLWQTLISVLTAFFGVRSSASKERDIREGSLERFILLALLATLALVGIILLFVKILIATHGG